jgi:hypothetical protein
MRVFVKEISPSRSNSQTGECRRKEDKESVSYHMVQCSDPSRGQIADALSNYSYNVNLSLVDLIKRPLPRGSC